MFGKVFNYGGMSGLIAGVLMFALAATSRSHPSTHFGEPLAYVVMLLAALPIFVAIRRYRSDDSRGKVGVVPGLAIGLAVAAVAAVVYALCWELTLAWSGIDYAADHAAQVLGQAQDQGVSGAALDQLNAHLQQFRTDYAAPSHRLAFSFMESFPTGAAVALVSALLLSNPRFMPLRGGRRR
ncbi:MAG: DUF4199 domain-containing protein [Dokdonella sp.]|uniref:DUF4199 domain-containing protein n=1 Tax=Dokdonella sp. TaxID=2291710 RepID=UPI0025C3EFCA|nr:DUF4199 domain-containing protein [Dokdonella sp.]MBX3700081.1 DUF4199 domain-containing protein [Dokdonella sp.]